MKRNYHSNDWRRKELLLADSQKRVSACAVHCGSIRLLCYFGVASNRAYTQSRNKNSKQKPGGVSWAGVRYCSKWEAKLGCPPWSDCTNYSRALFSKECDPPHRAPPERVCLHFLKPSPEQLMHSPEEPERALCWSHSEAPP